MNFQKPNLARRLDETVDNSIDWLSLVALVEGRGFSGIKIQG